MKLSLNLKLIKSVDVPRDSAIPAWRRDGPNSQDILVKADADNAAAKDSKKSLGMGKPSLLAMAWRGVDVDIRVSKPECVEDLVCEGKAS